MSEDAPRAKASVAASTNGAGTSAGTPSKRETASFETLLDEFAAAFVRIPAPEVDSEIEHWLQRFVEFFDADRSSLGQFAANGTFLVSHAWARPGYGSSLGVREQDLPWLVAKLRRGETFVFSSPDEIPPEATSERLFAQRAQILAHVSVPLAFSGQPLGVLAMACVRRSRAWSPAVLQRLRLVGTVFGNALARKRAIQEYLQLSRTLEHAGRVAAIGQLASSFAHEIKQPLGASLTNAQTALRILEAPHPDLAEVRAALQDIVADNRRAGDIVNELRRFMRRQEPSISPIHVRDLFDAVMRFVSPEARNQGVDISVDTADGTTGVLADRVQIQQVFVNLLLNSFDALHDKSPGQRRVLLAAAPIPGNRITLSVSDSGSGVPEHLRSTLFEPFVTSKPQGLGIGLAIAQTIIAAHGSRLSYCDARDGGAKFTFSLAATPREVNVG
jgi:signal transduction histidine kinase